MLCALEISRPLVVDFYVFWVGSNVLERPRMPERVVACGAKTNRDGFFDVLGSVLFRISSHRIVPELSFASYRARAEFCIEYSMPCLFEEVLESCFKNFGFFSSFDVPFGFCFALRSCFARLVPIRFADLVLVFFRTAGVQSGKFRAVWRQVGPDDVI